MSKKNILIISISLAVVVVTGILISVLVPNKTILGTRASSATTTLYVNYSTYNQKIDEKEDFIIYVYSNSCGACINFKPILNEFISKEKIRIFSLDIQTLTESQLKELPAKATPTLLLYRQGKLFKNINPSSSGGTFKTVNGLEAYFRKYVEMPD